MLLSPCFQPNRGYSPKISSFFFHRNKFCLRQAPLLRYRAGFSLPFDPTNDGVLLFAWILDFFAPMLKRSAQEQTPQTPFVVGLLHPFDCRFACLTSFNPVAAFSIVRPRPVCISSCHPSLSPFSQTFRFFQLRTPDPPFQR